MTKLKDSKEVKIIAKIEQGSDGLFMLVNGKEDTAWAIKEDEIIAIRDACEEYLESESQRIMMEKK